MISWVAGFTAAFLVYAFEFVFSVRERKPPNAMLLLAPAAGFLVGFLSRHPGLADLFSERVPDSLEDAKPYAFDGHLLYRRTILAKNGGERTLYFFAKVPPTAGALPFAGAVPAPLPQGYAVDLNQHTGQPFLRKAPRRWMPNRRAASGAER